MYIDWLVWCPLKASQRRFLERKWRLENTLLLVSLFTHKKGRMMATLIINNIHLMPSKLKHIFANKYPYFI